MRASQILIATLKEPPKEAELISHQLMLRASMIRKLGSGLYTWLPLGLRVLRKVEKIVREEMNAIGAQELLMPAIQPAELWQETGRWTHFGPQLLQISDRHKRSYCFGPTHEEVITDLARQLFHSPKQLPCTFYQIQTKFRDEIRPRFGIMRAREFLMKDAYSFHLSKSSLQETYDAMHHAYTRIFSRLGLTFRVVLADPGAIGGSQSHEFHVLAESGEDILAYCLESDYAANRELASAYTASLSPSPPKKSLTMVDKRDPKWPPQNTVQVVLVRGKEVPVVGLVLRGDHTLNAVKAEKCPLLASPLTLLSPNNTSYPRNLGPLGFTAPLVADHAVLSLSDFCCGASEEGKWYTGVNWERDLPIPSHIMDLRMVVAGDRSPDNQGTLAICRGIEVGHIFQLGTKYSEAMQALMRNKDGVPQALEMGCYGIGVSRIVAAAIEQHHDKEGICWPLALAPFHIVIIPIAAEKDSPILHQAFSLYESLQKAGFEVLLDDRPERPGVLFADNDLLGIPHRLIISQRSLSKQQVEYKRRTSAQSQLISLENILSFLHSQGLPNAE